MVTIMTDSSSTLSITTGAAQDIVVNPLTVTIDGETYLDLEEMTSEVFLGKIAQGHLPVSSQPSVGQTLDCYQEYSHEEILNLTIADGLSGTYQTAQGAVACMTEAQQQNIRVVNTKTLWANQHYLVQKAKALATQGLTVSAILEKLHDSLENHCSYLIPSDFGYLKRGGRLSPLAANVGGLLKLIPVLRQTADGKRLDKAALSRGMKHAFQAVHKGLKQMNVGKDHLMSISHADNPKVAQDAMDFFRKHFPLTEINLHALSPSMITQGGPQCMAVQVILK